MTFTVLETGAIILALLIGLEMRRQQRPWRSVLVRSLIVLGVFTALIVMWRGR